jgi:hypothetical protein
MKITQDIREAAAGMKAKSEEFKQKGGELYVKQ